MKNKIIVLSVIVITGLLVIYLTSTKLSSSNIESDRESLNVSVISGFARGLAENFRKTGRLIYDESDAKDMYSTPYQIFLQKNSIKVISAGKDMIFNTDDDVSKEVDYEK